MKISIAIMAHPSREKQAVELLDKVNHQSFSSSICSFDDGRGEWGNGKRLLEYCAKHSEGDDYLVVLQDDAIISDNFYENVANALQNMPERTLLSFYTGTVRPYPQAMQAALERANDNDASYLWAKTLYWGVGYAIPAEDINPMLEYVSDIDLPYDQRIGQYYYKNKRGVLYTVPSLVDHDYRLPSLVGNDRGTEPRRAWNYESGIVRRWNNKMEVI